MSYTNLRRIRKEKRLTQKQLAELSGVNLKMIQKYETGEKNINHARAITLTMLATALKAKEINLLELDKNDIERITDIMFGKPTTKKRGDNMKKY